eukprot:CAMPEP_0194235938 /NCGR_PEP_ID=MMETSP0158-20130606/3303_1 /TAXON_ID=33649 /ORGANISM="Thalassionema nitzschioides, Strain L26-B" /LENGTH=850 /DNA_ID=CAMNT_0038969557 /DNA_START=13 /DNA_END=2565 /DNA_ORIENTATION=-
MIAMSQGSIMTSRNIRPPGLHVRERPVETSRSKENDVHFNSILRIRPFVKNKEKEDHIVLQKYHLDQKSVSVAVMHPPIHLSSIDVKADPSNFIQEGQEQDFHFDKVIDENSSQEAVFYASGLSIATTAMEPLMKRKVKVKDAVIIAVGVADSGKTHTIFGKVSKTGHGEEGLVPRILESLFSQSKHKISSSKKTIFGVRMTLLQVDKNNEVIRDLLREPQKTGTPSKKAGVMAMVANFERPDTTTSGGSSELSIEQDKGSGDFVVNSSSQICRSVSEARELLQSGLHRGQTSRLAAFGKNNCRGHIIVTLQPVLLNQSYDIERFGGSICLVDMASKEKGRKSNRSGQAVESIPNDTCIAAIMHCFRTLKHNKNVTEGRSDNLDVMCDDEVSVDGSEISCVSEPKVGVKRTRLKAIPWRQSKVTMLLQPSFSPSAPWLGESKHRSSYHNNHGVITRVTLLMNAYPGHRDYSDTRSILNDLEILHGYDLSGNLTHAVQTGLDSQGRNPPTIVEDQPHKDLQFTYSSSEEEYGANDEEISKENQSPNLHHKYEAKYKICASAPPPSRLESADSCVPRELLPPPVAPVQKLQQPYLSKPPYLSDFPGVVLPASSSNKVESQVMEKSSLEIPKACNLRREKIEPKATIHQGVKARNYELPLVARVKSKPNIQPPSEIRKNEPVRDKSSEITEKVGKCMKELEEQNQYLIGKNAKLEEKCELLEKENSRLQHDIREIGRRSRQQEWTTQDESQWRDSRKIRLKQQNLIQSPLQQHLGQVEETYQNNSKWLESRKQHFSLKFPSWWTGAKELNQRDKALSDVKTTPIRRNQVEEYNLNKTAEKKTGLELCKRLKKY